MLLVVASACSRAPESTPPEVADPRFVGSSECADCHTGEFERWTGSHHQLAMQVATPETVLGDFNDASIDYREEMTRFSTSADRFVVQTEKGDGELQTFDVTHAFGITPLQQYLVNFPGGRKQALPFAWDTRPEADGGQRWYSLYPDDLVDEDDPLHWTGRYYNWNFMCAECHSTNVSLGYQVDTDSFDTTFDEISVGCEACHGPGSLHVVQAETESFDEFAGFPVDFNERQGASWIMNLETGIAERSTPNVARQEAESCGRCHARRSVVAADYEYGRPLTDTHMPSLLDEHLYYADGRIQDEVYVYGSFVQSKMYAAGVTCSDCHDPHSGSLRSGPDPNDICAQCHLTAKFASDAHAGEYSARCVDCHMPATTYMGVDDRRDHSFRLPDTGSDPAHYGHAIAAGRAGSANRQLLDAIADPENPAIARATMLTLLEPVAAGEAANVISAQLEADDPLLRVAALRAMRDLAPAVIMRTGSHLLRDPVRGVRIEAALTYVDYRDLLPIEDARAFADAANEFRAAILEGAAMPGGVLNLAGFEQRLGNAAEAARLFRHLVVVGPRFAPGQHAYGLFLVRSGQAEAALEHLRIAADLEPEVSRYAYVYGVALNSLGESDAAVEVLTDARNRFESDFDIGWALATIYRDRGELDKALSIANDLHSRFPGNPQVASLIAALSEN